MFFEIGVVKNFAIFTGKHLFESVFEKIARLKAIKKTRWYGKKRVASYELRVTSYELKA